MHEARPRGSALVLHTDLLKLRREEPVFRCVQRRGDLDGAVFGTDAFVLRYFGDGDHTGGNDRLLLVNLGSDLSVVPGPNPYWPRRRTGGGRCSGRARSSSTAASDASAGDGRRRVAPTGAIGDRDEAVGGCRG